MFPDKTDIIIQEYFINLHFDKSLFVFDEHKQKVQEHDFLFYLRVCRQHILHC